MIKKKNEYDFIVFKKKLLHKYNLEEDEIDVYYEYVVSKLNTKSAKLIVSKFLYLDKSLEIYDIAIEIACNLRRYQEKNKNYIPTWQHIKRGLYNFGKKFNLKKTNKTYILNSDNFSEYIPDKKHDLEKIEECNDLYIFLKNNLNKDEYSLIIKYYIEKYTLEELSKIHNVSKQAIGKRINKIIKKLKEKSPDF